MFKNEDDFKKIIARLNIDDNPKDEHRENLRANMLSAFKETCEQSTRPASQWPVLWRKIMRSSITKLAAAAVIMAVVVLGVTILEKTSKPAWAIENTIKALENAQSLMMAGKMLTPDGNDSVDFTIWAVANTEGSQSERVRFEGGGQIMVSEPNATYDYRPLADTVFVRGPGEIVLNPWPGSKFFETMKKLVPNYQAIYGKDNDTGCDCVYVTFTSPNPNIQNSWWFAFDLQTNLPIKFKQWKNRECEGQPWMDVKHIVYNPQLPEGVLNFTIPKSAKVIRNEHQLPKDTRYDSNHGMFLEGMSKEEACVKIVTEYYQAILAGDWELVNQLRIGASPQQWQQVYSRNNPIKEIIEVKQPYQQEGCSMGLVTPCVLKYADDTVAEKLMIVAFKPVDGKSVCVIVGTWGQN